jgi:hypothetical protein
MFSHGLAAAIVGALALVPSSVQAGPGATNVAVRALPEVYASNVPSTVAIVVTTTTEVAAHAIEDAPPEGWLVSAISDGGAFDRVTGKVKWGPFYDAAPVERTLTYAVTPPDATAGTKPFAGVLSIDGINVPIAGHRTVRSGLPGFTDSPLVARRTPVMAVHLSELRQRVNELRAALGLTAVTWTDATLGSGTTPIRAVHLAELRAAVAGLYAAAGRTPPTYTDPSPAAGTTVIAAAHVNEIRAALNAIR